MRLEGKVALITGSGHGIGRGIAHRFAAEGARVMVADLDPARAGKGAAELKGMGAEAAACDLDVRSKDSADAAVAATVAQFGRLDVLVNNAGIMSRAPFLEMTEEFFKGVIQTNLVGTFLCGQAAARQMVAQIEAAGTGARSALGRIINIASNSGVFGGRGRAAYGASKAGIINLTQTMAIELAEKGILVNAVAPGPTRPEAYTATEPGPAFTGRMSLKRFGTPDEVGRACVFLASDDATFTNGHVVNVDGGFTVTGVMEG